LFSTSRYHFPHDVSRRRVYIALSRYKRGRCAGLGGSRSPGPAGRAAAVEHRHGIVWRAWAEGSV